MDHMVKLPKEIQKKKKKKPKRPSPVKKREGHSQFASRQMRRKMQAQGIDMDEINATRVIIEGPEKSLVIEQPEVVLMKQMGQEIYQVVGSAEEYAPGELEVGVAEGEGDEIEEEEEIDSKPEITENDIMLVAAQTGVEKELAKSTLEDCDGDIAKAIILLKNR